MPCEAGRLLERDDDLVGELRAELVLDTRGGGLPRTRVAPCSATCKMVISIRPPSRATRYLQEVNARPVWPTADALRRLDEVDGELPAEPTDPTTVLTLLDAVDEHAALALCSRLSWSRGRPRVAGG